MLSPGVFFHIFEILIFWAKRAKNCPKLKITIISVTCRILGTVKHIMIFGALVLNDDISRVCFHFF